MATTREPNIQSTERDQKQNVIAAMNSFYFQVLCLNVLQFPLNRNVFYRYDDELLEIWNLVRIKRQTGQAAMKDSKFTLLYLGTTNVRLFPFSSARVSYEILSMESSLFHGLYVKKSLTPTA